MGQIQINYLTDFCCLYLIRNQQMEKVVPSRNEALPQMGKLDSTGLCTQEMASEDVSLQIEFERQSKESSYDSEEDKQSSLFDIKKRQSFVPGDFGKNQQSYPQHSLDEELAEWSEKDKHILQGMIAIMKGTRLHEIEERELDRWAEKHEKMEEEEELMNFEEGIFVFTNIERCCLNIPVDEESYVEQFVKEDARQFAKNLKKNAEDKFLVKSSQIDKQLDEKQQEVTLQQRRQSTAVRMNLKKQLTITTQKKLQLKRSWEYAKKICVYDARSLYLFHHTTYFRKVMVGISEDNKFKMLVWLCILLNSLSMLMYEYSDRENNGKWNKSLQKANTAFSIAFIVEFLVKVIARGLVMHPNAYLRDGWNWLDGIVVVISVFELASIGSDSKTGLQSLRTLRVLRPLRSLNAFPAMKRLIVSLGHSLTSLSYAGLLLFFVFLIFGIFGIKQFSGNLYQRCRIGTEPDDGFWPYVTDPESLCTVNGLGGRTCPLGTFCAQPSRNNIKYDDERIINSGLVNYGVTTFDNLPFAFVTIFQMITLEGWVDIMYLLIDSGPIAMSIVFSVFLVVICSFFLMNVILAILSGSIQETKELENPKEIKQSKEIAKSIKRARMQRAKKKNIKFDANQTFRKMDDSEEELSPRVYPLLKLRETKSPSPEKRTSIKFTNKAKLFQNQPIQSESIASLRLKSEAPMILEEIKEEDNEDVFANNQNATEEALQVKSQESSFETASQASSISSQTSYLRQLRQQMSIPSHAKRNRCFFAAYSLVQADVFNVLFMILTIGNTVLLATDRVDITNEELTLNRKLNQVFTYCFCFEMVVKLIGLGFREYVRDYFNIFDAILVIISMLEEVTTFDEASAFSSLRAIRLLRIVRLARSWKTFNELLIKMAKSLNDVSTFGILLFISMTIFTLIGLELYAYKIQFSKGGEPVNSSSQMDQIGISPRMNFDNSVNSFITIFIVIVGDDWNSIMYDHYRVLVSSGLYGSAYFSLIFFIVLFIAGHFVLLNLFLAILLSNFEMTADDERPQDEQDELYRIKICCLNARIALSQYLPCLELPDIVDNEFGLKNTELEVGNDHLATPQISSVEVSENLSSVSSFESSSKQSSQLSVIAPPELLKANLNQRRSFSFSAMQKKNQVLPEIVRRKSVFNPQIARLSATDTFQLNAPEKRKSLNAVEHLRELKRRKTLIRKKTQAERLNLLKDAKKASVAAINMNLYISKKSVTMDKEIELQGHSLCILGSENKLRIILSRIMNFKHFDNIVLCFIIFSTILLILENPLGDQQSTRFKMMQRLDQVMTGVFAVEALVKIAVYGFTCNGRHSYLRDGWNTMDFTIVCFSVAGTYFQFEKQAGIAKLIRLFRIFRPLRMLSKNPGMKNAIESLINSVPEISNLLVIALMNTLLFGILGTNLFKGKFGACHFDNVQNATMIVTMWDCYDFGGEWVNPDANFDNVVASVETLFTVTTTEGWVSIMWSGIDAAGRNLQPVQDSNRWMALFFIGYMIIGSLFILNLFVGVVITNFNLEKEKLFRNNQLTPLQAEYCDTMAKCYKARPNAIYVSSGNMFIDNLHHISSSSYFENFIFLCIALNTSCMAGCWYGQPTLYTQTLEQLNLVFSIIYTVEAVIKLLVLQRYYFSDQWNSFDFVIVIASWLDFVLEYMKLNRLGDAMLVFRTFRIARVFRMIKQIPKLRTILATFFRSMQALTNVAGLLLLLLLFYAILGVLQFATVAQQETLNEHANFTNFWSAMLTLLRMITGESWNEIMWDSTRQRSILFQCEYDQTYEDWSKPGGRVNGCGSPWSKAYFVTFMIFGSIIFLNMFIAIILEGFDESKKDETNRVQNSTIQTFIDYWQKFDPEATGLIRVDDLKPLIVSLIKAEVSLMPRGKKEEKDLLFNLHRDRQLLYYAKMTDQNKQESLDYKSNEILRRPLRRKMHSFISSLEVPSYNNMKSYNFHDTLVALVKHLFSCKHRQKYYEREQRILQQKEMGMFPSKWDLMEEGTIYFLKLSSIEQEMFLELSRENFQEVVDRIEVKGNVSKDEEIQTVAHMKGLRELSALNYVNHISHQDFLVIDSSQIEGARIILKYVVQFKERRNAQKLEKMRKTIEPEKEVQTSVQSEHVTSIRQFDSLQISSGYNIQEQISEQEDLPQEISMTNIEKPEELKLEKKDSVDIVFENQTELTRHIMIMKNSQIHHNSTFFQQTNPRFSKPFDFDESEGNGGIRVDSDSPTINLMKQEDCDGSQGPPDDEIKIDYGRALSNLPWTPKFKVDENSRQKNRSFQNEGSVEREAHPLKYMTFGTASNDEVQTDSALNQAGFLTIHQQKAYNRQQMSRSQFASFHHSSSQFDSKRQRYLSPPTFHDVYGPERPPKWTSSSKRSKSRDSQHF